MKQMPANSLDPRVKNVWRINDALAVIVNAVWITALVQMFRLGGKSMQGLANTLTVICLIVAVAALVVVVAVLPSIRFMRWRYEISDDYLDIATGIIWRKRFTIPFIRVQNTDTRQGPILRAFGLASVTVATAAKEHVIPGLDFQVAEQLRDRAAELARLAREDV